MEDLKIENEAQEVDPETVETVRLIMRAYRPRTGAEIHEDNIRNIRDEEPTDVAGTTYLAHY